jgi:hypothetical protein
MYGDLQKTKVATAVKREGFNIPSVFLEVK